MSDLKVGAVIVTYNPEINRLKKVIDSIANQIDNIIIVDNNSKNIDKIKEILVGYKNIEIIENDNNYGIGKALNIGVEKLKDKVDWILTLDQDSIILKNIREIFLNFNETIHKIKFDAKKIGIISLNYINNNRDKNKYFYTDKDPIISGSIVNSIIFRSGIKYREEFFLDCIDSDFDFLVRNEGYLILTTTEKSLDHELGRKIKNKDGKEIRFEPEWRVYLLTRNIFKLLIEHKLKFKNFINQILIWDYKLIKVKKIKEGMIMILRSNIFGILDGIRNKLGPPYNRYKIE